MKKTKIMVVDDEVDILTFVKTILEFEGYAVLTTTNGEEALSMASTSVPDLIILDVKLPGIDGYEVCRRLKKESDTRAIPILMFSASFHDVEKEALEAGADDFIKKLFTIDSFLSKVRQYLGICA